MLGVLLTVLVSIGAVGMGKLMIGRLTGGFDPAVRLAAHGLNGLAGLGFLTLFVGLLPGGLNWGIFLVGIYAVAGGVVLVLDLRANPLRVAFPKGLDGLFILAFVLGALVSLAGVLSPSDPIDWDSLSYHLAVPKLYLQSGQIHPLFIHQSNFPSLVDYLYIWGLKWGDQYGAKAFSFCFYVLGLIGVFGVARNRYGLRPGYWAALAFAFVPVILWESGTAYIDLANGLYAGLGIALACAWVENRDQTRLLWLTALFLGYAAASKYTGLQTILAVCLVLLMFTRSVSGLKIAVFVGIAAAVVASPWYIKNIVYVGNPVFPFFYEKFGGKNWDERRAEIYRDQQLVFGIPPASISPTESPIDQSGGGPIAKLRSIEAHKQPKLIGADVFGLAYKPAEYIDAGQPRIGAIGAAVLLALMLWLVSGRAGPFEKSVLSVAGLSLVMWVALSQQSRYMVPLMLPLAVLLGGGVRRLAVGPLLAGVAAVQALYSLWVLETDRVSQQMLVLTGKLSVEEYQKQTDSFYEPSSFINEQVTHGKVALYDETFGFLLDRPYMWANPGHSTEIPYDSMNSAADYSREMVKLGFSYAYVNVRAMQGSRPAMDAWYAEAGLAGPPVPMPNRAEDLDNWQVKYKVLVADAIAQHLLIPVQQFRGGGILLQFRDFRASE